MRKILPENEAQEFDDMFTRIVFHTNPDGYAEGMVSSRRFNYLQFLLMF